MKICDRHDRQLRKALRARGLESLIVGDPERAAHMMIGWSTNGEASPRTFEPYLGAINSLINKIAGVAPAVMAGIAMSSDETLCPVCQLNQHHEGYDFSWMLEQEAFAMQYVAGSLFTGGTYD